MNKKKKIFALILTLFMVMGLGENVFAGLFIGGKLERGVSNMYYYVDSTAEGYTYLINNAVDNWVDTGYGWNPIYMSPVASNYATDVDFYAYFNDDISGTVLAKTTFYDINEGVITPEEENWFFSKIQINDVVMGKYTVNERQGTIAHELGHAFGLDHQNFNKYSIMCQIGFGREVQRVDETSHNAINTLYN